MKQMRTVHFLIYILLVTILLVSTLLTVFQGNTVKNVKERSIKIEKIYQFGNNKGEDLLHKILPRGYDETNDRIIEQLKLHRSVLPRGVPPKLIVHNFNELSEEDRKLEKCGVKNCILSSNWSLTETDGNMVDAVVIMDTDLEMELPQKKENQIWVFFMLESPEHTYFNLEKIKNKINWTATYRVDSTLVTPYFKFLKRQEENNVLQKVNYAKGKTKLVAWFVSNCNDHSGRMTYVKELQRYITVDIYGLCGDLKCSRDHERSCDEMLARDYKFYLAFENSKCKDYVTEKPYNHGFMRNVVPIVLGAPSEEYQRLLPPNSYIHVDKFASPKLLAQYLRLLDSNDVMYNAYFRWKSQGEFVDTYFWCRLCAMLHQDLPNLWYDDIGAWWTKNTCVKTP